ncbi:MAG: hypothetical protein FWD27_09560 [Coriobacteriia bacterium]|nr:hypothetical protein [Coriobacteriia bacterium]
MKNVSQVTWQSALPELQLSYLKEFRRLDGDLPGQEAAQSYLNDSSARYRDSVIGMGFLPKLLDKAALSSFEAIVSQTYGILKKMTQQYAKDAEYRSLFRFSPLLEQLILLPSGYSCTIPICRIDIFLDERTGDFKFCEFNTDGTSAMNEDREIADTLAQTATLKSFAALHQVSAQELFDPWVEAFFDIYHTSTQPSKEPVIAIVDYMESAVKEEQLEFQDRFERHGARCMVCDISSLEFIDGALYGKDISKGHPAHQSPLQIDAIYRRAVTYELLHELEQSHCDAQRILSKEESSSRSWRGALALLAAVAENKVCLIGSFATQVAHSKASFCLLHHPKTKELLTQEECEFVTRHVPYTTWLKEDAIDIPHVKETPERWIIKPVDGYGTKGVYAGKSLDKAEWSVLINEKLKADYIIQEYCDQYQTDNILPLSTRLEETPSQSKSKQANNVAIQEGMGGVALAAYNILTGLYCYGGALSGVYTRAGRDALIVGFRGGITLATLLVDTLEQEDLPIRTRSLDV